jgi:hypothetical protein
MMTTVTNKNLKEKMYPNMLSEEAELHATSLYASRIHLSSSGSGHMTTSGVLPFAPWDYF